MRSLACGVVVLLTFAEIPLLSGQAASDWPNWSVAFVAHRGGIVPGYPENTLAAFRQAIRHGADAIEVDLRGRQRYSVGFPRGDEGCRRRHEEGPGILSPPRVSRGPLARRAQRIACALQ